MTKQQTQVAWLVETTTGTMFWPVGEHAVATTYCEDGAEPVPAYCDVAHLERHIEAQEGEFIATPGEAKEQAQLRTIDPTLNP